MKTKLTLLLLLSLMTKISLAGNYQDAMKSTLAKMENLKSPEEMQALSNAFERIASKEKTKWLPYYYASLLKVMMIYNTEKPDNIEAMMNEADDLALQTWNDPEVDSSEIYCLQSMIASARIMENPMTKGAKYGPMAEELLVKAQAANPDNPRVYLLQGESKYYTPAMWGGSKKKAKELFLVAQKKYQNGKPSSDIAPNWGADRVADYLEKLK